MTTKEINLVLMAEEIVTIGYGESISAFPSRDDYLQEVLRVYESIKEEVK